MELPEVLIHAQLFADHLRKNRDIIHFILGKYQSFEVIEDELKRSLDVLENLREVEHYLKAKTGRISVFLPLNLPLYSFIIFAAVPSYQSKEVFVRPPEKMQPVLSDLYTRLEFDKYFPSINLYLGQRESYLNIHCKTSSVVIFTGKYENFIKIREACGKQVLVIYNGVGHNPLVIAKDADLDLAIEKTIYVKLFNNGQDCAGPDVILVDSHVIEEFQRRLIARLETVKVAYDYSDSKTRVGPLFEQGSLTTFNEIIGATVKKGGKIVYGGVVDYKNNVIWPTVARCRIDDCVNFEEVYSPLFILTEYSSDDDLRLYFDDPDQKYAQKQMYISVFGTSGYLAKKVPGSIIISNMTIHDVERGNEEYGGYGPGASAISHKGLLIFKPILIPREIFFFLSSEYSKIISAVPKGLNPERYVIEQLFHNKVQEIFSSDLIFGYIFGSYARNREKSYSDIDMLICVSRKDSVKSEKFIQCMFEISEVFGKVPDFMYPTEIVTFSDLSMAVENFPKLILNSNMNSLEAYDAMIWLHSLSHYKMATINEANIPTGWEKIFPDNSTRLLKSFLADFKATFKEDNTLQHYFKRTEIPEDNEGISAFISSLGNGRKLINTLKYIPFKSLSPFKNEVRSVLKNRNSFGRRFIKDNFMLVSK